MTAITVSHHIAAPLQVIDAELGLLAQNQAQAMTVLEIKDEATFAAGNRLLIDSHKTIKELEAARVRLKKPISELGREIDKVVASVAEPLEGAKRSMQSRVAAYQRAAEEAARRAREQAEAIARAEREAAEKERARLQAEADAKAKREAEELSAVLGAPVEPEAIEVVLPRPAEVVPAPVVPAPPKASAIQMRKVKKVEIYDRMLVPTFIVGIVLRPIDETAVRKALEAGANIPGARLIEVEIVAMGRAS